jgi:molybdenum cofactor synthesis domain-containing protein
MSGDPDPTVTEHRHQGPAVEIVSAGNEVLSGDVLDTNSNWLCRRIAGLGGHVRRTAMVRDEVKVVATEVRAALARRPALLFTVGGLGPTDDDLTLAGIASATDRPLELNTDAERMVRERYQEFAARGYVPFAEMNEARRKMARLPRGATPVTNPIGGAPGVLLEVGETAVVSLPGVPEELQAIVDESLADLFGRIFGAAHYEERALVVELQDESAIAAQLRAAQAAYPHVYVKSRAKLLGSTRVIRVTLAARDREAAVVDAQLSAVAAQLRDSIAAAGYRVHQEAPPDTA